MDGEGRYLKVNGSTGTNPVTGVTYTASGTTEPIGSLTNVTYGSVDNDNFTYDTGTGRLGTYTFAINSVNDKGTLTWNTNGTLSKLVIADSLSGSTDSQTCNYYYDDLGRLGGNTSGHSVDCGSTKWQQLFTFDAFGNIVKSGSSNFAANYTFGTGAITNQLFQVSGASISYDGDGNLLTDNLSNTYTWDPNWGNPASVNTTNLIYDALGQMVEQQNGSSHTQILYSQMGKTAIMTGQTLTKAFVYLPGGGTAIYGTSGPTGYRHSDWLGSSRVTSNPSRTPTSYSAYAPYGEQYTKSATVDPSFATMNADTNSTLYDAIFREYSSTQGRWTSPDPAGLAAVDPRNPQTWNRYAYVTNNPLGLDDPTGLFTTTCPQGYLLIFPEGTICFNPGGGDFPPPPMQCGPGQVLDSNTGVCVGQPTPPPSGPTGPTGGSGGRAPSNAPLPPAAQNCQAKIQGAVNNALNTNSTFLGPTVGPGMNSMGFRNGAYNFNYFAPGVVNPVAGSNGGSGRFPGFGLDIPLPGGADPTIMPWGYNAAAGGSYFTAHFDSANPTDDLVGFFEHIINDVILRRPHGC